MNVETRPLKGMRVIEMSTYIAVPSCGRILAEMGAEVIKLEPVTGDSYRRFATEFYKPDINEQPLPDSLNCYKKSVAVNLKDPRVPEYIYKLIETSDVFLTNTRQGALERLGLGYEVLKEINPRLIYAFFTGYGEKGPKASRPGYDSTSFLAPSGILRDFVPPDAPPMTHVTGLGDMMAGLSLCTAILCALINVKNTGKGTVVTSSLSGCAAWGMVAPLVFEQYGSHYQREYGNPMTPVEASYRCSDGVWVIIVCGVDRQWEGLARAINKPELINDPRFLNGHLRSKNNKELFNIIASEIKQKPYVEWERILLQHDVPFEKIHHVIELAGDEQLVANDFIYSIDYPSRKVWLPRPPFKIYNMDDPVPGLAPQVGEHTKEVFLSLGCPEEEIKQLADTGALAIWEEQHK